MPPLQEALPDCLIKTSVLPLSLELYLKIQVRELYFPL